MTEGRHLPVDTSYDASDEEATKKAQAAADLRRLEQRQVAAALMASPQGRTWVWQILMDCHVFEKRISMTGEHENGFFEGQREVGLQLFRAMSAAAPSEIGLMLQENDRG